MTLFNLGVVSIVVLTLQGVRLEINLQLTDLGGLLKLLTLKTDAESCTGAEGLQCILCWWKDSRM